MGRSNPNRSGQQVYPENYRYSQFRWVMVENRLINDLTERLMTEEHACSVNVMPDVTGGILNLVIQSNSEKELIACDEKTVSEVISFCETNAQKVLWLSPAGG